MSIITREEALELIKGSSKYNHSLVVCKIMEILAELLHEDKIKWGLVGLLHDLDYDIICGDMSMHGVVAAEMLNGKLSEGALHAIRAHDHRTGVEPHSLLDGSLIFADGLAILMEDQRLSASADAPTVERALLEESEDKPWIAEIIRSYCRREDIEVIQILRRLRA